MIFQIGSLPSSSDPQKVDGFDCIVVDGNLVASTSAVVYNTERASGRPNAGVSQYSMVEKEERSEVRIELLLQFPEGVRK